MEVPFNSIDYCKCDYCGHNISRITRNLQNLPQSERFTRHGSCSVSCQYVLNQEADKGARTKMASRIRAISRLKCWVKIIGSINQV